MRVINLIMNSYTSSLYTKNYTHYTLDILAFCYCKLFLNKKKAYLILQPLIWRVCLWCAFWCCFVRACARFVWVSFSSFICRSSWSFFVCARDSEVFVSRFEFDSRIRFLEFSKSYFEVEFRIRLFRFVALFDFSNLDFRFEFRAQVPWIFASNFEFEFFVSLLYSISRIWLWIRRRIRLLEFRVEFQIRSCRRNFRFVALFDFSNFVALFDFSNFVAQFDFSNFEFSIRIFDSSALISRIRSCRRNFRCLDLCDFSNFDDYQVLEFVVEIVVCEPSS